MAQEPELIENGAALTTWLSDPSNEGRVVKTHLKASDRVIARVTDGIYRQPSSALRELISNAWDADAQNVTILTDAPRFSRIYVRDDGVGMSDEALARLLHNIGGSSKRQPAGGALGVTRADDPDRSPAGRLLIGKIGIGLFSISQLARRFQVITKVKDTNYRLVAEIRLRAYSEDGADDDLREGEDEYVSGSVLITREHSDDLAAHGTDIVLDDVKPRVRDILRSADRWRELDEEAFALSSGEDQTWIAKSSAVEPKYHSGWIPDLHVRSTAPAVLTREARLPWSADDAADVRMGKLVDAVESLSAQRERPDLATTLDSYLEMLWTLGLSAPVEYVDSHPFDLKQEGSFRLFWLSNDARGKATEVQFDKGVQVRAAVEKFAPGHPKLSDGVDPVGRFKVVIDGVELRRPVRFKLRKSEKRGLDHAMIFVGQFAPNLDQIGAADRGGKLAFEAYLFWTGKVIPKENNGVLVRIRGASGALFDRNFFNYQISEQTRLRQITSEIYIQSGMDAALNIDRESFNFAHPHVQLVSLWLHGALRQLTNRHKDESAKLRAARRADDIGAVRAAVVERADELWRTRRGGDPPPEILIARDDDEAVAARREGYVALVRAKIPTLASSSGSEKATRDAQAEALMKVLAAFGLIEEMSFDAQHELMEALLQVFFGGTE